jgi:GxxExxY protein
VDDTGTIDALSGRVIGGFYRAYDRLGYGFLESVCRGALRIELEREGLRFATEVALDAVYDGVVVGRFRADLIVEGRLIAEVKAGDHLLPACRAQLVNYLRITGIGSGLLLHFGPSPRVTRVNYGDGSRHGAKQQEGPAGPLIVAKGQLQVARRDRD